MNGIGPSQIGGTPQSLQMLALRTDLKLLERPTQLADLKAARRELADNLLAAARGELPFEDPGDRWRAR
jgi:hypothetical protein